MEHSPKYRILVSGSTGFVGSSLVNYLKSKGHTVVPLSRSIKPGVVFWDPHKGQAHLADFEKFDAIIHLAGKSIFSFRWTQKIKKEIFQSRCRDTWFLSQILLRLSHPPKTLICASAIGYYGSRKDEILTEESPPGKGFLSDVCVNWEKGSRGIEDVKIRDVHLRFGLILSPKGGILAKLLPLFKWGLGAIIGSGKQYLSWIALEDALDVIDHILVTPSLKGAINFTTPFPETAESFAKKLASHLHRPLFFRIGETLIKGALGEMGEEMLLASTRAVPKKLIDSGYTFSYPKLTEYLKQHSF